MQTIAVVAGPRHPHRIALAVYVLLVLATLGPLQPFADVWGGSTDDFFEHVQLVGWQAWKAAEGRPFPLSTTDLAYPDGGSLFLPDPIGGTAAVPFVWVFGYAFAYNLLMLADLIFACWAMFWLARRRTSDFWAALLAGGLYGLSPVLLGNLNNGITEIMQGGWLPLFLGLLLTLLDRAAEPGDRRADARLIVATGVTMMLVALGQWYYGIYACLLFGLVVPARARLNLRAWWLATAALAVFAVTIFPVAAVFAASFKHGGALFYLGNMDFYLTQPTLLLQHSADPAHLFSARGDFENYLHLGYVGFVVPALAVVGLARRRWRTAAWLGAAAFFIVLAFGPFLGWNGEAITRGGEPILMPYYLLYKIVPYFKEMRLPYRFFIVVHLCLALAVAHALTGLAGTRRWRPAVFVALFATCWIETAMLSGAPVPAARQNVVVPAALQELAALPTPGAVFDLPLQFGPPARGRYLVGQLVHRRPLVYGIQGRDFAPSLRANLTINVLALATEGLTLEPGPDLYKGTRYQAAVEAKACLIDGGCPDRLIRELAQGHADLIKTGVRYLVLHHRLIGPDSPLPVLCERLAGAPVIATPDAAIFFLDETAPPAYNAAVGSKY
jgi:hypothetical protein